MVCVGWCCKIINLLHHAGIHRAIHRGYTPHNTVWTTGAWAVRPAHEHMGHVHSKTREKHSGAFTCSPTQLLLRLPVASLRCAPTLSCFPLCTYSAMFPAVHLLCHVFRCAPTLPCFPLCTCVPCLWRRVPENDPRKKPACVSFPQLASIDNVDQ